MFTSFSVQSNMYPFSSRQNLAHVARPERRQRSCCGCRLAPSVRIGDEVEAAVGLALAAKVVGVGCVVAEREERAGELGASALAVDIVVGCNRKLCQ